MGSRCDKEAASGEDKDQYQLDVALAKARRTAKKAKQEAAAAKKAGTKDSEFAELQEETAAEEEAATKKAVAKSPLVDKATARSSNQKADAALAVYLKLWAAAMLNRSRIPTLACCVRLTRLTVRRDRTQWYSSCSLEANSCAHQASQDVGAGGL